MSIYKYLESVMIRISNLIYNSQWENTTKEELTKHLQYMLDEYNEATGKNIK